YRLRRLTWFYALMGTIPVADGTPDPGALKSALKVLSGGGVVGIFPEGQRVPDGSTAQWKAGAALIAARSGVPVVPAAIIGAHRAMPIGSIFPRPYTVRVVFGPPLVFPPWQGRRPTREQLEEFADVIMRTIGGLMGEDREASVPAGSNMRGASR
ncbi:MAG TPA: lysophospholipid acyltransferase family protein, partial [Candidatus Polarisedimenticolia bacterium]|nr:lysophospholipid acyltransferase family protein [Candidatus Polarisedimenticolia bacterium]